MWGGGVLWSPGAKNFSHGTWSTKPFSTWSQDKNANSGQMEPWSEAMEPSSPKFSIVEQWSLASHFLGWNPGPRLLYNKSEKPLH